jgi:hypothetical protein
VPGLGQHETGRTLLGIGVLSAVGGAVYLAFREELATQQRQAEDPFGNPYTYDVRVRERPYQTLGLGAAVAIGLGAALESFLYARGQDSGGGPVASGGSAGAAPRSRSASHLHLSVGPADQGVNVGFRWKLRPGGLR